MTRAKVRRLFAAALTTGSLLPAVAGVSVARAAVDRNGAPPGVDPGRPTVNGRLVAKGTGTTAAAASCGNGMATVMVKRGLVICTDEGRLVLLQITRSTAIYNGDWQRMAYARLDLGDRLHAWGILRDGGTVLNPTVAIRDLSRPGTHYQTVSGQLVASPDVKPGGPVVCADRDRTAEAQQLMVTRGVVICTNEGRLVLLQISSNTRLLTQDRARVTIEDLTLGDRIVATGTLRVGGHVLDPALSVQDANLQLHDTNSQDFIARSGGVLMLYVLQSDAGPVQGRVLAQPGEPARISLCGGVSGTWRDLRQGLTVNIRDSIFNTRTMTYVDATRIAVVNCR